MNALYYFSSGAVMMGSIAVGLYFYKYWTQSRDRLFLVFAVAFMLLGLERIIIAAMDEPSSEAQSYVYIIRCLAFILIFIGIIDKNRRS